MNIADLKERAHNKSLVVLFGAGISVDAPSNLPVGPSLSHAITLAFEGSDLGPRRLCPARCHTDPASDNTWWEVYKRISGRDAFRLEVILEMMTIVLGARGLEVLAFMNDVKPNQDHSALARLASDGTMLLTTNFDCCVEQACYDLTSAHMVVLADDDDIVGHYSNPARVVTGPTITKLHGSLRYPDGQAAWRTIVATLETLSTALSEPKRRILDDCLSGRTLLVAGYSARDFFDVYPYLMQQTATDSIVWVNHDKLRSPRFTRYPTTLPLPSHVHKLLSRYRNAWVCSGSTSAVLEELCTDTSGPRTPPDGMTKDDWRSHVQNFGRTVRSEDRVAVLSLLLENVGIQWAFEALLEKLRTHPNARGSSLLQSLVARQTVSHLKGIGNYRDAERLARAALREVKRSANIEQIVDWHKEMVDCLIFLDRFRAARAQLGSLRELRNQLARSNRLPQARLDNLDDAIEAQADRLCLLEVERLLDLPVIGRLYRPTLRKKAVSLERLGRKIEGEVLSLTTRRTSNAHRLLNVMRHWIRVEALLAALQNRKPGRFRLLYDPMEMFDEIDSLFGHVNGARAWATWYALNGERAQASRLLHRAARISRLILDYPGEYKAYRALARIMFAAGRRRIGRHCVKAAWTAHAHIRKHLLAHWIDRLNLALLYFGMPANVLDRIA